MRDMRNKPGYDCNGCYTGIDPFAPRADVERETIREHHQRFGFESAAERYGEATVRAAWLPEDEEGQR
jgi:hypothetical protein